MKEFTKVTTYLPYQLLWKYESTTYFRKYNYDTLTYESILSSKIEYFREYESTVLSYENTKVLSYLR
jgi:hypothetical protein